MKYAFLAEKMIYQNIKLKDGICKRIFRRKKVHILWKSFPASKDCDMEKDKGCKITTPDEIGEETIYLLER